VLGGWRARVQQRPVSERPVNNLQMKSAHDVNDEARRVRHGSACRSSNPCLSVFSSSDPVRDHQTGIDCVIPILPATR
jgi:hypothetical protein